MASLAISPPEPRLRHDLETRLAYLIPIPHSPESMDGIPYFDEEFQMVASDAHRQMIYFLGALLDRVAQRAGLRGVSDCAKALWRNRPARRRSGRRNESAWRV